MLLVETQEFGKTKSIGAPLTHGHFLIAVSRTNAFWKESDAMISFILQALGEGCYNDWQSRKTG